MCVRVCVCACMHASEVRGSKYTLPFRYVQLKILMCVCIVALMKLNDYDQTVLQVTAASLITILWGLMVVFPFIQVSELLDHN